MPADIQPAEWLCAVIDTLLSSNKALPFKVVSSRRDDRTELTTIRILNRDNGAVWTFRCGIERGPA
ncbi:MAG: hypothetical protein ACTHU0_27925 [Kofleriaceae bacterium]